MTRLPSRRTFLGSTAAAAAARLDGNTITGVATPVERLA